MKLDIPPTRMQLLHLKRRGSVARRGHKLLKDKQDELMRRILEFVYRIRELRLRIEEELRKAFGYFYFASSKQAPKTTDEALLAVTKRIDIEYHAERILNLKIPKFVKKIEGWSIGYGFLSTSGDLDLALLKKIVAQAKEGRLFILKRMMEVMPASRAQISKFAPKIKVLHVPVDKIGEVIGPGGRIIKGLIRETGAAIDVEDDGTVNISSPDKQSVDQAVAKIEGLIREVEVGEIFEGEVKRIQPFGAFVEITPGKEGLVHVSKMSTQYVADPSKIVKEGDKVKVKVVEIDDRGRINLSMILEQKPGRQPVRRQFPQQRKASQFGKRRPFRRR